MAGILANSASKTMISGETAVDDAESGYLTGEQVTLSTFPAGTAYQWGIAKPAGSSARAALSSTTGATPVFTPDVAGFYTVSVTVDSVTAYVIRISVTQVAITTSAEAYRAQPKTDASVTAPSTGEALFFSEDVGRWRVKDSAGAVRDFDPGARTGTLTLAGGAGTITDTSITANTVAVLMCTSASDRGTLTWTTNIGTSLVAASSDGSDASVFKYALLG